MLKKLENNEYSTDAQFAADVRLIWQNALTFNTPTSAISKWATKFAHLFECWFAETQNAELAYQQCV